MNLKSYGMKGGLQNTLFGIWKVGTEQQQHPITLKALEKKHICSFCRVGFGNAGALKVHHVSMHNPKNPKKVPTLSSAALQQVAWPWLDSNEVRERQETLEKNVEEERENQMDAPSVLTEPEAAEPRPKQRRIRRDVEYKARVILLLQTVLDELSQYAEEKGLSPPTLKDAITSLREVGFAEPESNLYRWFRKRSTILEKYADKERSERTPSLN